MERMKILKLSWKENVMKNIERKGIISSSMTTKIHSDRRTGRTTFHFEYGKRQFTAKSMQKMKPLFDVNDETIPEDKKSMKKFPNGMYHLNYRKWSAELSIIIQ